MPKQGWLVAVGSGTDPLPDAWTTKRPELLTHWPMGKKMRSGIASGDHLIYYAAHHQALIAVVRATESGAKSSDDHLRVQTLIAIPRIAFAPSWRAIGRPSESIEGQKAILLTDSEFDHALEALLDRSRLAEG